MSPLAALTRKASLQRLKVAFADALWIWAQIELELFDIFRIAISGDKSWETEDDLRAAFYAVNGAEIRLAMTNAIASKSWGGTEALEEWNSIYKEINKARRKRGQLAHKFGTTVYDSGHEAAMLIQGASPHDPPYKIGEESSRAFNAKQLEALHVSWARTRARMHQFRLGVERARLQAFLERPARQRRGPRTPQARTPKARK